MKGTVVYWEPSCSKQHLGGKRTKHPLLLSFVCLGAVLLPRGPFYPGRDEALGSRTQETESLHVHEAGSLQDRLWTRPAQRSCPMLASLKDKGADVLGPDRPGC